VQQLHIFHCCSCYRLYFPLNIRIFHRHLPFALVLLLYSLSRIGCRFVYCGQTSLLPPEFLRVLELPVRISPGLLSS
jgi:hypothetical protein